MEILLQQSMQELTASITDPKILYFFLRWVLHEASEYFWFA